jgi:hypothetical protein
MGCGISARLQQSRGERYSPGHCSTEIFRLSVVSESEMIEAARRIAKFYRSPAESRTNAPIEADLATFFGYFGQNAWDDEILPERRD